MFSLKTKSITGKNIKIILYKTELLLQQGYSKANKINSLQLQYLSYVDGYMQVFGGFWKCELHLQRV